MTIRKPICVKPLDLFDISTGNSLANRGATHLGLPQHVGMRWQSEGNGNLWVEGNFGGPQVVDFCSLMATNATAATQIRLRLGDTKAEVSGVAPYDSGALALIDPPTATANTFYHSHLELNTPVTATWWRIDITGHTGDFSASALIMGKKLEPAHFYNRDRQIGREDLGQLEIARNGVVAETPGAMLRTLLFRLQWVSDEEFFSKWDPLVAEKGKRQLTYWCFDPEPGPRRQDKTFLGYFARDTFMRGNDFPKDNQMDFQLRALL